MTDTIATAAREAAAAWRRTRAIQTALWSLVAAFVGAGAMALGIEILRPGLAVSDLPRLAWWLLLPALGLLVGWGRRPALGRAATELDRRAGLADRLATALEFAGADGGLVGLQRADAAAHAQGVAAGRWFGVVWRRVAPALGLAVVFWLVVVGLSLTFHIVPPDEGDRVRPLDTTDRLLEAIGREQRVALDVGDKEAQELLIDMERRVRRIQAREEEVLRAVREARPEPQQDDPDEEIEEQRLEQEPPQDEEQTLITAADLDRLQATALGAMELTPEQNAELVSQLFNDARKSRQLNEQVADLLKDRRDVSSRALDGPAAGERSSQGPDNKLNNSDMLGDPGRSDRMTDVETDMDEWSKTVKQDLSGEAMAEHERQAVLQESFNQFLNEFVKDAQSALQESSGRKKKPGKGDKEVAMATDDGVADKRDAMAEAGFEEMDGLKRADSPAEAPDSVSGSPTDGGTAPQDAQMGSGPAAGDAMMMKGETDGGTTSGAQGAGHGEAVKAGEDYRRLAGLSDPQAGPLEKVLGQIAAGRLPPEQREQLFERLAQHKVQGGQASEADDVIVDYFAEAEELMSEHRDELPPLFRDYAHNYFEAIRPGGGER